MPDRSPPAKETLRDAKHELKQVLDVLDRVGLRIDGVMQKVESVLGTDADDLGHVSPPTHGRATDVLEEQASLGVATLDLVSKPDGSWMVRIDGGRRFRLQRKVGTLLAILAASDGELDDTGLVGWKSYEHVATRLGRKGGGPAVSHDVTQTTWKLRVALDRESQNRFLVQSGPQGIRFALRRDADG